MVLDRNGLRIRAPLGSGSACSTSSAATDVLLDREWGEEVDYAAICIISTTRLTRSPKEGKEPRVFPSESGAKERRAHDLAALE